MRIRLVAEMKDYLQLPIKEKIIFNWIRLIYLEFKERSGLVGYKHMVNKYVVPMVSFGNNQQYDEIVKRCPDAIDDMKQINGNHYHMNLFIELEKLCNEAEKE